MLSVSQYVVVTLLGLFSTLTPSSFAGASPAQLACEKPVIFFDVGGTLVDTDSHNFNPMYFQAEAPAYLKSLKEAGFPLGLISDVPEEWGRDLPEVSRVRDYDTAKLLRMLSYMQGTHVGDATSWQGPAFDPTYFGSFTGSGDDIRFEGRIFLPRSTAERKRSGSSVMFERGAAFAKQTGCPALYVTIKENELERAAKAGLVPFWVGHSLPGSVYLPPSKISEYIRDHTSNVGTHSASR